MECIRVSLANFALPLIHSMLVILTPQYQMVLSTLQTLISISEGSSWLLGTIPLPF